MRSLAGLGGLLLIVGFLAVTNAAPPQNKLAPNLDKVDADKLRPGTFSGVLVSVPNNERMFTLKITYPEVRLKPGAKMPNLRSMEARTMHQIMQQMNRAQQMPAMRGAYRANAFSNMMQMEQRYMQGQQRMAQAMARAEQQELQLLRQEIRAIQNMYQVVPVTHEVDFQAEENVKVRTKDVPDMFDDKGIIKKYTRAELLELKGKDKNLMGYESSLEALKPGQTVLVSLRTHKKPATLTGHAVNKDKEMDIEEADSTLEHKMQVKVIVILKDGGALSNPPPPPKKNKK